MDKERIIASIKERILSEHKKHQTLDWAEIAARKIYATYDMALKKEKLKE